jgi:hypothetical protein
MFWVCTILKQLSISTQLKWSLVEGKWTLEASDFVTGLGTCSASTSKKGVGQWDVEVSGCFGPLVIKLCFHAHCSLILKPKNGNLSLIFIKH